MWQAAKVFLLGKAVLVSTAPMDIGDRWVHVTPQTPLTAITAEAHFEIHVAWPASAPRSMALRAADLEGKYAHGCVKAQVLANDKPMASFKVRYAIAGKDGATLVLVSPAPVPQDVKFDQVLLRATCPLGPATVEWRNDGKRPEPK